MRMSSFAGWRLNDGYNFKQKKSTQKRTANSANDYRLTGTRTTTTKTSLTIDPFY